MSDQASLTHHAYENKKTEEDTLVVEEVDTHDVAPAAGETPNPISDFIDFMEYRVSNTIVRRMRKFLYETSGANAENLAERQDIRFQGFEWVIRLRWINEFDTAQTWEETVEEGLTIRDGQETEQNFNVSASFRGLGVDAGGYRKNFSERETSSIVTVRKTIVVPAHTTVYLYQKRYNFLSEVWFWQHVPRWANYNHFRVGANGTYQRVQRTAATSINAEEYATIPRRLSGTTTITAQQAPSLSGEPTSTRQFVNITQRAKNELARFGIRG